MAEYMDGYGVADARRAKLTKWIVIGVLAAIIIGTTGYFTFQNWSEERVMHRFVDLLKEKNYQEAYRLWDKPDTHQSYTFDKFSEDWSATGVYKNPQIIQITNVDACDAGVVFTLAYPGQDDAGIWVERDTKIMSFYGEARCRGKHLQIMEYLRSLFGRGSK